MALERRVTGLLVGYGVTMLAVLVAARWRPRRGERRTKSSPSSGSSSPHRRLSKLQSCSSHPPSPSPPTGPQTWARSPSSQMGSLVLPSSRQSHQLVHGTVDGKLVIVMVGLPARGKSYIVKMVVRYLSWSGYLTKAFNVGNYRRKLGYASGGKSFIEGNNAEGQRPRAQIVHDAQEEMYDWLREDDIPKVALLDATNATKARRKMLLRRAKDEEHTTVVFVESICDDPLVLAKTQNYELKLTNDDYKHQDPNEALRVNGVAEVERDFEQRVKAYEAVYESIDDEDGGDTQYMKLYNVGQKMVTRNCNGYRPSQVAFILQNMHIRPRKVWLTRHAKRAIIPDELSKGHDTELTEAGRRYSMTRARCLQLQQSTKMDGAGHEILVLAGTRRVDYDSVAPLQVVYPVTRTPLLNDEVEESSGDMDRPEGQSKEDPVTQHKWDVDQMESASPAHGASRTRTSFRGLGVVCHEAVHRCLYAYYMGIEVSEVPSLDLPQHQLTELSPSPFGTGCRHISESEMMQHLYE